MVSNGIIKATLTIGIILNQPTLWLYIIYFEVVNSTTTHATLATNLIKLSIQENFE
jgi:hypothetical protein